MALTRHDLAKMSFRKVVTQGAGEITMDGQMMRLLMEIKDGEPVVEAAKRAGFTSAQALWETLEKLIKANLIQSLQAPQDSGLGEAFAQQLNQQLAAAVGPMADFILTRALTEIGYQGRVAEIPKAKAASLIMHLARQIPREEKRADFQKVMLGKIPK